MDSINIVSCRLQRDTELTSDYAIRNANDAIRLIVENFNDLDRENLFVINCDVKLKPNNINIIAIGSENSSATNRMILLHNHPTNILKPSKDDKEVLEKAIKAGKLLGIEVIDSVIFNYDKRVYSIVQDKEVEFDEKDYTNESVILFNKNKHREEVANNGKNTRNEKTL